MSRLGQAGVGRAIKALCSLGRAVRLDRDGVLKEEAVDVPQPVGNGAVYEHQPAGDEEQVCRKANTVRKGSCYQSRGDDGEHHLIPSEDESRYFQGLRLHRVSGGRAHIHVEEQWKRSRAPNDSVCTFPKNKTESYKHPENTCRSKRNHNLELDQKV